MAEKFDAVDVIRTKRDKGVFSPEEIDWVIDAYTRGVVGDEQMAALNMAIFLNGMNREEISQWTKAMIASGETMSFESLSKKTADKHSTVALAIRSRCRSRLSLPPLAWRYRSFLAAAWATPVAPWTSWKPSRAGRRIFPMSD